MPETTTTEPITIAVSIILQRLTVDELAAVHAAVVAEIQRRHAERDTR